MQVLFLIKEKIKLLYYRRKWRNSNKHNYTVAINAFGLSNVSVGRNTYGGLKVVNYNRKERLVIGAFCSIAQEVTFILNADHRTDTISTYPFKVMIKKEQFEGTSKGDIIIEDDVWIGYRAVILSGVHIGQGAVISACAVVTKDIPPYAIAGGVPARIISYRFSEDIIKRLLKKDIGQLNDTLIKKHIDELYCSLNSEIDLEWLPVKKVMAADKT